MRVYVIGTEGQVARSLREAALRDDSIVFGHSNRADVDLLQRSSVSEALAAFRPDVVINPAAYTAVDKAESEPEQAFAINRDAAAIVAAAAAEAGAPIVHFSTDYVFDGRKSGAYVETDETGPQGVYGRSKLEGERAVAEANQRYLIVRTSWVFAPFGNNFVRTMLRLSGERDRLGVVDDQVGCPTYAPDLADAVLAMASQLQASDWPREGANIVHLAGPDALSWCGFARQIVAAGAARGGRSVPVDPIPTSAYPTPAARPTNSQLSSARLASVFGIRLRPLTQSLAACLDRLVEVRTGETS